MTINLRDVLTVLAIISFAGAAYNASATSWYAFISFGPSDGDES